VPKIHFRAAIAKYLLLQTEREDELVRASETGNDAVRNVAYTSNNVHAAEGIYSFSSSTEQDADMLILTCIGSAPWFGTHVCTYQVPCWSSSSLVCFYLTLPGAGVAQSV
jgi:hypothetical protein